MLLALQPEIMGARLAPLACRDFKRLLSRANYRARRDKTRLDHARLVYMSISQWVYVTRSLLPRVFLYSL